MGRKKAAKKGEKRAAELTKLLSEITGVDADYIGTLDDLDAAGAEGWFVRDTPAKIGGIKGRLQPYFNFVAVHGLREEGSVTWYDTFFVDESEYYYLIYETMDSDESDWMEKKLRKKYSTAKKKKKKSKK